MYWVRKVAELGIADAQYILGMCYKEGEGIKQDYVKASSWFEKAAEQGHKEAENEKFLLFLDSNLGFI